MGLNRAQLRIFQGAIDIQNRSMKDSCQKFEEIKYTLDLDTVIDAREIEKIRRDRYSRKPIVLDKVKN